jgi:para-nitrobenzyl esterase
MTKSRHKLLLAAALFLFGTMVAMRPPAVAADNGKPVIHTAEGPVQGYVKNGISEFLGIPYAAPPVGDLRWQPPKAHAAWTETLKATKFGNTCPQITELGVFAGPVSVTEDCLYLNVFTTRTNGHGNTKKLPVLLWIHGGGLFDGESNDYDASALVKGGAAGPTVVVTLNYRLGLLGYLGHPALDAEGHDFGNYGLMDQQEALRWIQRNIAVFGGDPGNVTLGGQSAGSTSTAAAVISPASAGLFHRAIFQSGPLLTVAPLALAEQRGADFAKAAGCGADSSAQAASCLRALSVDKILALQGTAAANGPYVNGLMVDGKILPMSGDAAWSSGKFARMPIMNGPVADEGAFTASIDELFFGPMTVERFTKLVKTTYGGPAGPGNGPPNYQEDTPDKVMQQYPLSAYATPGAAWTAITTDANVCRHPYLNNHVSAYVPLYAYEFTYRKAPWYFPALNFDHGAAHTIDIQFLFPDWHGGPLGIQHSLNKEERALSGQLVTAWTNFMYTGNPNLKGDKPWPRYTKASEVYLSQNVTGLMPITAAEFATEHKCAFWDTVLIYETPSRS